MVERVPLAVHPTPENVRYLRTKRDRMGHDLPARLDDVELPSARRSEGTWA